MLRTAAMLMSVFGLAISATAQDKELRLPENTIDCKQFKKTGTQEWREAGTAVFDLGKIKDINLTNQPVTPHYFKFGGIDLYTVVEQKCGAVMDLGDLTAQAPVAPEKAAATPKPELAQDNGASASVQMPAQANIEVIPVLEKKIAESVPESASCGDKKSVYVADSLTGADGVRGLIEIVFNKETSSPHTDLVIREYRNNKVEWVYNGKKIQDQLIFTPVHSRQKKNFASMIFTPVHLSREKPVMLTVNYVKPNREGTGEAILYLGGLRTLFAKKNAHRFKFEGNRPSELLPESFYFSRCE